MKEFGDSKTLVVAEVDCIGGGKSLCEDHGIRGYPSLKYGDPTELKDYTGGRYNPEMSDFAQELAPTCSPARLDLCDDERRRKIEEFQKISPEDREALIERKEE